jgi:hypothetical protein
MLRIPAVKTLAATILAILTIPDAVKKIGTKSDTVLFFCPSGSV